MYLRWWPISTLRESAGITYTTFLHSTALGRHARAKCQQANVLNGMTLSDNNGNALLVVLVSRAQDTQEVGDLN